MSSTLTYRNPAKVWTTVCAGVTVSGFGRLDADVSSTPAFVIPAKAGIHSASRIPERQRGTPPGRMSRPHET